LLCTGETCVTKGSSARKDTNERKSLTDQFFADVTTLPIEYNSLSSQVNFKSWSCTSSAPDLIAAAKDYANSIKPLAGMDFETTNKKLPDLDQYVEASYDFSTGEVISMLLSQAALNCTGQTDLATKISALAVKFSFAGLNALEVEHYIIRLEHILLLELLDNYDSKEPKQTVPPPTRSKT